MEVIPVSLNPNFTTGGISFVRVGNIMTLNMHDIKPTSDTVSVTTQVAVLDVRYAPQSLIEGASCIITGTPTDSRRYAIHTNGLVELRGSGGGYVPNVHHTFSATWGIVLK